MNLTDEQIANLTPEQIEQLENDPEAVIEGLVNQEEATESGDEPEQAEEGGAANGAGETEEEDEPVVLNKSGKGTIPYEKHKALRVENATLREQLQSLQQTKAELESLRQQKAQATTPSKRAEIQKQLTDRIAVMKEDFPDIGSSFESVNDLYNEMMNELAEEKAANKAKAEAAEAERKAAEEKQQQSIAEQVQEAKENNPDLVHWEKHDEDAWNEAMMQDEVLRRIPKWANKSYEERFEEVVKRVRAVMPEATKPPTEPSPAETKEKAKAKLEKAPVRKPTTLSDIQGGANPASEKENIESLPVHELAKRLMTMPAHKAAAMRAELD